MQLLLQTCVYIEVLISPCNIFFPLYSYYPLHPPAEDVNLDYEQFEKYALLPCNPDILILPSDLRYFAKVSIVLFEKVTEQPLTRWSIFYLLPV